MDKCCFCGVDVDYKINGNDPRPIKIADNKNPVCCNECNARIVIPTRRSIWDVDTENFLLKEKISVLEKALENKNQSVVDELNKVHKFFSKTFVDVGLNTYCEKVRPVETFIIEEIKKLKGDE